MPIFMYLRSARVFNRFCWLMESSFFRVFTVRGDFCEEKSIQARAVVYELGRCRFVLTVNVRFQMTQWCWVTRYTLVARNKQIENCQENFKNGIMSMIVDIPRKYSQIRVYLQSKDLFGKDPWNSAIIFDCATLLCSFKIECVILQV